MMNNPFCKYKNILGEPNKGVHSYRVMGVAIADVLMTVIGAVILAWYFRLPYLHTIIALFVIGIALHRLFCVRTTVDKWIFG